MTIDRISYEDAEHLTEIYMLCVQSDIKITICKESLEIVLPCGAVKVKQFEPVGNKSKATSLIYAQLRYVKKLLRELEEKESCFDEKTLRNDYLNGQV